MNLHGGNAVFTLGALYACFCMTWKKEVEIKILVLLERPSYMMREQFQRRRGRIVRLDKQKHGNTGYCDVKRKKESSCKKRRGRF